MGHLINTLPRQKKVEFDAHEKKDKEAFVLVKQGKIEDAVKLFRENLEWCRAALGQEHATTIYDIESLAFYLNELKRYGEASKLDKEALDVRTRIEGLSPPSTHLLQTQQNLANDYIGLKDIRAAAKLYEENYELRKKQPNLGEDHVESLKVGHELAGCWYRLRKVKEAKHLNIRILASSIRLKRPELEVVSSREALALDHVDLGELDAAETLYLENIKALKGMKDRDSYSRLLADNEKSLASCRMRKETKLLREQRKMDEASKNNSASGNKKDEQTHKKSETDEPGKQSSQSSEKLPSTGQQLASKQVQQKKFGQKNGAELKNPQEGMVGKPSAKSKPVSIPKITTPSNDEKPVSSSVPDSGKRLSLNLGSDNASNDTIPRRTKSHHGKPDKKFDFRHLKSSEALSQLQSQSDDDIPNKISQHHPIPGAIPGSWKINPADLPSSFSGSGADTLHPSHGGAVSVGQHDSKSPPFNRSPSPARSESDIKRYGQLMDAEEGKYDEESTRSVDDWFSNLLHETQDLLEQNRRNDCKRVRIAILDTGIDWKHPDFADDQAKPYAERRIKRIVDFLDSKNRGMDLYGHGTYCAGLLRKVAPWADIYIARVAKDKESDIDPLVVARAISRACGSGLDSDGKTKWNVDILSLSFGFFGGSKAVQMAIQNAINCNTLIFAAASNGGIQKQMTFPAWLEGVVCVNCALGDGRASGFNPPIRGANTLSIVGVNVQSAWITEKDKDGRPKEVYKRMSGTSVATPIAAGVAALVLEYALQNEPDSFMKDLDFLKHYNGMTEVLDEMTDMKDDYRVIVPWNVLSRRWTRVMVTSSIEKSLWQFREFT